jgi:hypothetical protein
VAHRDGSLMVEWRHRFMWFAADLAIATLAPSSSERMKERRTVVEFT